MNTLHRCVQISLMHAHFLKRYDPLGATKRDELQRAPSKIKEDEELGLGFT
jgi:hypothetical protein